MKKAMRRHRLAQWTVGRSPDKVLVQEYARRTARVDSFSCLRIESSLFPGTPEVDLDGKRTPTFGTYRWHCSLVKGSHFAGIVHSLEVSKRQNTSKARGSTVSLPDDYIGLRRS